MFAFPSFNTEKDVIAYKSFMLADRMEAQWSQNSQNVLLLMVHITNLLILHYCNFTSYFHKFPILPPIQTFNFCPSAISRVIFSNFRNWRQFTYAILTLLQFH